MVERETELLRHESEPAQRVLADDVDGEVAPACILLHLSGHDRATVGRAERLEPPRRARERADREVPTAVRRDERAAVHDATISDRPREHGHEGARRGDRAGCERRAKQRGPERADHAVADQERERGREREQARMHERAQADDETEERRAEHRIRGAVPHPRPTGHDDCERRQRLGHHERRGRDETRVRGHESARDARTNDRELVACEAVGENGEERADASIEDRRDVRSRAEHAVGRSEQPAVADRPVAPGMPNLDAVGIAEARGDASRAEVVVVSVPHGLARPRDGHVEARQERRDAEQRGKPEVASAGGSGQCHRFKVRFGPRRATRACASSTSSRLAMGRDEGTSRALARSRACRRAPVTG